MIGKDQAHQSKIVVTVQMTDKNMINAAVSNLVPQHLNLGSLPTIDQKQILVVVYQLGSVVPSKCE